MTHASPLLSPTTLVRMEGRLRGLYGTAAQACLADIVRLVERYAPHLPKSGRCGWDQRDIVLITYGDQLRQAGRVPLDALRHFLVGHGLEPLLRTLHILPFYPYSSDDGFSVIDYRAVDPALGDWRDIDRLAKQFELMFDLVLNHVSRQSRWFTAYLAGQTPYVNYFHEVDPQADLSQVTRPRSLPLLTEFDTSRGQRHVWTTFSSDQIDLNFAWPGVLVEMLEVLLLYICHGARIIRLDAVAYLWKQLGTSCIHLPQTHQVVKLLRDLVDAVAPHVILLTETNVPHQENVSYFGAGDEAHMVYQFSLPPLLLDAMLSQDARPLVEWLLKLTPPPQGTTYFNFTASHDGIGVRPLEGLVTDAHLCRLVEAVTARGGLVSTRRKPDGTDSPYELNISYVSALGDPGGMSPELHARRYLTSQGLMLSLQGVPAIYFHSLVGTPNDLRGAAESGQARRINRRKLQLDELEQHLRDPNTLEARVFAGYRHLLAVRTQQPAFHPDSAQEVWDLLHPAFVALLRTSLDGRQRILVVANVSDRERELDLSAHTDVRFMRDLLSEHPPEAGMRLTMEPFQLVWLEAQ